MSPHLASLKIQLCDVNGISLQKKEMRLASVLPGKEDEVGPTFGSPMCPTSPPPWAPPMFPSQPGTSENDKLIKAGLQRDHWGVCVSACLPECVLGKVGFANF